MPPYVALEKDTDYIVPEKTESLFYSSRAYSASFAFLECQVIYFFQLFFQDGQSPWHPFNS